MIWVPALTFKALPFGSWCIHTLVYFGFTQTCLPFTVIFFFLCTTLSWSTPLIFIVYALAPSVCKMTSLPSRNFLATGFQSRLVIGPGPGDRLAVVLGESLKSTSVSGRPRSTRPPHCSQRALFWSISTSLPTSTSSASTSTHFWLLPNLMAFSFFRTCWSRASSRFLKMRSTGLWFISKMMGTDVIGTPARAQHRTAAWFFRGVWLWPEPEKKMGWKSWGCTYLRQPWTVRLCAQDRRPFTKWSPPSFPMPQWGHVCPSTWEECHPLWASGTMPRTARRVSLKWTRQNASSPCGTFSELLHGAHIGYWLELLGGSLGSWPLHMRSSFASFGRWPSVSTSIFHHVLRHSQVRHWQGSPTRTTAELNGYGLREPLWPTKCKCKSGMCRLGESNNIFKREDASKWTRRLQQSARIELLLKPFPLPAEAILHTALHSTVQT